MSNLKWDNWGLPVKENDDISESCKDLAIHFINIYCYKKLFDLKFKKQYPQRAKNEEETADDSSNYLNSHYQAYITMLESQDIQFMQNADVHLSDRLNCLIDSSYGLKIHPRHDEKMNNLNLIPMLCCLNIYEFTEYTKAQDYGYLSMPDDNFSIFSHLKLLMSVMLKNKAEVQIPQMILAKEKGHTWVSKLAQSMYFKRYTRFGNIKDTTIEWLLT